MGYGKPGICVDTHVHRISNRLGYVKTRTSGGDRDGAPGEAAAPATGSATTTFSSPSARTSARRSLRAARSARSPRSAARSESPRPADRAPIGADIRSPANRQGRSAGRGRGAAGVEPVPPCRTDAPRLDGTQPSRSSGRMPRGRLDAGRTPPASYRPVDDATAGAWRGCGDRRWAPAPWASPILSVPARSGGRSGGAGRRRVRGSRGRCAHGGRARSRSGAFASFRWKASTRRRPTVASHSAMARAYPVSVRRS